MRKELAKALDRPRGGLRGLLKSPVAAALDVVGEEVPRAVEAMPIIRDLATGRGSTQLRQNAILVWPDVILRTATGPYRDTVKYAAERAAGEADMARTLRSLVTDGDGAVRAAAAVVAMNQIGPSDWPAARVTFGRTRPDIESHRDLPGADEALRRLAGPADALGPLRRFAASTEKPTLRRVAALLDPIEKEPIPEAAAPLRQLYERLPAVIGRKTPERVGVLPGVAVLYDEDSTVARLVASAFCACVPLADLDDRGAAVSFILKGGPDLVEFLLKQDLSGGLGAPATLAVIAASELPTGLRMTAVERLGQLARWTGAGGDLALARLRALISDPVVGGRAERALGEAERERPRAPPR